MTPQEKFQAAQDKLKTLSAQPNDVMLKLYGLYKQASLGDATGKKPGMLDFVAKAKFEAWESFKGLSKDQAMTQYAAFVNELAGK